MPGFIKGGYPIGPHAVVAAVSRGTGAGLVDVFAGFTMALAPLFGLLGIGLLGKMSRPRLIVGASLVALSYLGAAYLTQGAFKEPLQAMLLIGFAVALASLVGMRTPLDETGPTERRPAVHPVRRVLPLAVIAAASVFNYSLPGLLWVGAVGVVVLIARWFLVAPSARGSGLGRRLLREAIAFAASSGYAAMILWTVSALTAAAHLYRAEGFERVAHRPARRWSVDVVEEKYFLRLAAPD